MPILTTLVLAMFVSAFIEPKISLAILKGMFLGLLGTAVIIAVLVLGLVIIKAVVS